MVDPESVRRRLGEIDRRLGWLRELRGHDPEEFDRRIDLQAQAERHLQLAIQSAIDVALHVVAEDTAETPDDYGDAFAQLAGAGILDRELAGRLSRAAGLRNILVHGYLDVDPRQLREHLHRLEDLESFAAAVQRHLQD